MKLPEVSLTALDRVVAWFSPRAGLERQRARVQMALASGYTGARRDKPSFSQWRALSGTSADHDTLGDLPTLRARSRDLVRNDPLAASAIQTRAQNVIGPGHVVRPEIDAARLGLSEERAADWEDRALAIWDEWASSRDCDITRTQNFAALEDLVYRSRLLSGDVFAVNRFRARDHRALATCVQVVEADRVSNPKWAADSATLAGGIELNRDGAPNAYYIADRAAMDRGFSGAVSWRRVPAFTRDGRPIVLHIHGPRERPDLTRYAPLLSPVIESLKQRSRYSEAELVAAVVSACFAVGIKSPDGALGEGLGAERERYLSHATRHDRRSDRGRGDPVFCAGPAKLGIRAFHRRDRPRGRRRDRAPLRAPRPAI